MNARRNPANPHPIGPEFDRIELQPNDLYGVAVFPHFRSFILQHTVEGILEITPDTPRPGEAGRVKVTNALHPANSVSEGVPEDVFFVGGDKLKHSAETAIGRYRPELGLPDSVGRTAFEIEILDPEKEFGLYIVRAGRTNSSKPRFAYVRPEENATRLRQAMTAEAIARSVGRKPARKHRRVLQEARERQSDSSGL